MISGESIALVGLSCTLVGLVYKFTNEEGAKRARIYTRIDEVKKDVVSKEICGIIHSQVETTLKEVKDKVDCVPAIKAGIDLLLQKNGIKNND